MPYIVTRTKPRETKVTFEDILFGLIDDRKFASMEKNRKNHVATRVYHVNEISNVRHRDMDIFSDIIKLRNIYENAKHMDIFFDNEYNYEKQIDIQRAVEKNMYVNGKTASEEEIIAATKEKMNQIGLKYTDLYRTFFIPKRSGSGYRRIDAPNDELSDVQRQIKEFFEEAMGNNTYHTSAFAYIKGRSTQDLVKKLQTTKCRWILKLDFSNFFGSIDIDFTMKQLGKIYPFSEYMKYKEGRDALYNCLKLCFLDGKLPQGTPFSPTLTNILMIPLDYEISNTLYKNAQLITDFDQDSEDDDRNYRLIYTRYADDIFIGAHRGFKYKPVIDYLKSVIEKNDAPFVIKPEKTRYSSFSGANWILGLMYNQNYDITIGNKKKKQISAMLHNFCKDFQNQIQWSVNDVQVLYGNLSYLGQIEPQYRRDMLKKYDTKFGFDVDKILKMSMKNDLEATL